MLIYLVNASGVEYLISLPVENVTQNQIQELFLSDWDQWTTFVCRKEHDDFCKAKFRFQSNHFHYLQREQYVLPQ